VLLAPLLLRAILLPTLKSATLKHIQKSKSKSKKLCRVVGKRRSKGAMLRDWFVQTVVFFKAICTKP